MFGSRNMRTQRSLTVLIRAVALSLSGMVLASSAWAEKDEDYSRWNEISSQAAAKAAEMIRNRSAQQITPASSAEKDTAPASSAEKDTDTEYSRWSKVGERAAAKAAEIIRQQSPQFKKKNSIALTNAGYAEINGQSTMPALDGLSKALKVSRGAHSLIEIHSSSTTPLWFAVCDQNSGNCAYLQVDPAAPENEEASLFSKEAVEQVNAEHIFAHPQDYASKFDAKIFGGNEFRIVTIANALTAGVSSKVVRAFEFHDHYCPGVTSGILMAAYIEQHFSGKLFIQSIQPWCKEDALQVILNTTPGKKDYDVLYPTETDLASWPEWAQLSSTIVYSYDSAAEIWHGAALQFIWNEDTCPDYGHSVMNKLCKDLLYVDKMDRPEDFVTIKHEFTLPAGVAPKELAGPGIDPVELIKAL